MYIWAQRRPSGAAAATSSTEVVAAIDTTYTVPAVAAARAVASSPASVKKRCIAVGATRIGVATGVPSTVVDRSTVETSRSTWGRSVHRRQASTFSRRVTPAPLPRARYSQREGLGRIACRRLVVVEVEQGRAHHRPTLRRLVDASGGSSLPA